jgi:hypothetical protein
MPERYEAALRESHVRGTGVTGRPITGYVFVTPVGCGSEDDVAKWVELAASFVSTLDIGSERGRE